MSKNIIGKFIYNPTVNDTKEANTQIPTKTMLNFLYEGNNLHIEIILTNHVQSTNKIIETPHLQVPGLIYLSLNNKSYSSHHQI